MKKQILGNIIILCMFQTMLAMKDQEFKLFHVGDVFVIPLESSDANQTDPYERTKVDLSGPEEVYKQFELAHNEQGPFRSDGKPQIKKIENDDNIEYYIAYIVDPTQNMVATAGFEKATERYWAQATSSKLKQ